MTPALMLHIGAGGLGILSGAVAVSVRKGQRLHRAFGTVFSLSILTMSALGAYLAFQISQGATIAVGAFTFYLVATAWATVRRKERAVGPFEYGAFLVALGAAATLLILGTRAAGAPADPSDGAPLAAYFIFASFGAFAAALDLKVILRGGISGTPRLARHLWRMCFALFFTSAFFFLGQQKVMPVSILGSPLLFVPAFAPLVLMIFWLFRIRFKFRGDTLIAPVIARRPRIV
jgi:hypothetical protein